MGSNIFTVRHLILLLLAVGTLQCSLFGQCDSQYYWVPDIGAWFTPENWQHEWPVPGEGCVPVPGVPTCDDLVYVSNGGIASINDYMVCVQQCVIEYGGVFLGGSGRFDLGQLLIGHALGSSGMFKLERGILHATSRENDSIHIGCYGNGDFIQSGGTCVADGFITLGHWAGAQGTYSLSRGSLTAKQLLIAYEGVGMFQQTGGTVNLSRCFLAQEPGSQGRYELLGEGTLNLSGQMTVGLQGTGFLDVRGGTVNGTSDEAVVSVRVPAGTLTGPGVFNIIVVYESDEIYGTYRHRGVCVAFDRNCLTKGGAYNVEQLPPAAFAGGNVSNLLESSVFDVSFDGSFCGEFTITIPYDQAEVTALDVNENTLVILHETGPGTYERLDDIMVDDVNDIVSSKAHTFGKFAVAKGKEFMITFDDGPVPGKMGLPGNTEKIVNALKNIKVANGEPVRAAFFMVGVGCCEDSTCYCPWYDRWPPKGSVRANHGIVQMVAKAPARHYIGVHTQHHPDFDPWFKHWSVEEIKGEISGCYNEIKKALNPNEPNKVTLPKIFRPPYFCNTPQVRKAAEDFQIILGAGENEDAAVDVGGRQWTKARRLIESWDRDYPCVLTFHDIIRGTAENIAEIIKYLQKEGFTLVHFDPNRLPGSIPSLVHHVTNTIHQSETVPHIVSLDSTVSTGTFNVSWEGSDLDLVLYKPDGTKIDSNSALADPNIKYAERNTYEYYTISDPNPGDWVMEVSGVDVPPDGETYTVRVEADTNLILSAFIDKPEYVLNEQINVRAQLANDQNSVADAFVVAKVRHPDGSVDNLTLYDDGTHGDEEPNDGFHTNAYNNTSLRGSYEITVSAIGEITGEQYERASSLTVMVGSIIYGNIDFNAYTVFANHWMAQNCTGPAWCDTTDIDQSGEVDIFDLATLTEYWLEDTSP